jgi:hypothetical protein
MDSMTLYIYNSDTIERIEDITVVVGQKNGTSLVQFVDETREEVDGVIFGAKPAGDVWIKTPGDGPVRQWENVEYLMTYPHHILVRTTAGRRFQSSGRILRVACE